MSSEKTQAIVLRVVEFSETSCVVTLFTRDFGKIGALAKGARRPKSPFESALDLLAVCRIVFLHKSSDALDLLTEAKLERRFRSATRNLNCLYAGYYVAELLQEMTDRGDPHPQLYDLADRTLQELDAEGPVAELVLHFELAALRLLGHFPALHRCAACGAAIDSAGGRVPFGLRAGGVLCRQCRVGQRAVVGVTTSGLQVLQQLARADDESWRHVRMDGKVRGELRGMMNQYLCDLLGRRPRMHAWLGTQKKGE